MPPSSLPVVRPTFGELGALRHPDWPIELPLGARIVDQQAALAGAGCLAPGDVKATYGTGVFVLGRVAGPLPFSGSGLLSTVAWSDGHSPQYALDGGVFAAGALLDWLAVDLGLAADAAALADLAASVPDSSGVRVLPALAGLGAPWWRPEARGVISGLHAGVRPAHVARAALEAIAWRVTDIVRAMSALVPLRELRLDGGLTNHPDARAAAGRRARCARPAHPRRRHGARRRAARGRGPGRVREPRAGRDATAGPRDGTPGCARDRGGAQGCVRAVASVRRAGGGALRRSTAPSAARPIT